MLIYETKSQQNEKVGEETGYEWASAPRSRLFAHLVANPFSSSIQLPKVHNKLVFLFLIFSACTPSCCNVRVFSEHRKMILKKRMTAKNFVLIRH